MIPLRVVLHHHERLAIESAILKEPALSRDNVRCLEIDPVGRLGWSGVKVYRVRALLKKKVASQYFYAKVGRGPVFDDEVDNLEIIQDEAAHHEKFVYPELRLIAPDRRVGAELEFSTARDFGHLWPRQRFKVQCLAYPEVEDPNGVRGHQPPPKTLNDHLQDRNTWRLPPDDVAEAVTSIIDRVCTGMHDVWSARERLAPLDWRQVYCRPKLDYLRTDSRIPFINSYTAGISSKTKHSFVRTLREVEDCTQSVLDGVYSPVVRFRPIHGDLHQRNIIVHELSRSGHAWVIDFQWTVESHALIDYALLETSLTNFYFARLISHDRLAKLRQVVLDDRPISKGTCLPAEWLYVSATKAIRKAALKEAKDGHREYFVASMLITMGLLSVSTADVPALVRHARWLAEQAGLIGKSRVTRAV